MAKRSEALPVISDAELLCNLLRISGSASLPLCCLTSAFHWVSSSYLLLPHAAGEPQTARVARCR